MRLIDHTKFAQDGLHRLAPLTAFNLVIVEAETSQADLADLRNQGVNRYIAGTSSTPPSFTSPQPTSQ